MQVLLAKSAILLHFSCILLNVNTLKITNFINVMEEDKIIRNIIQLRSIKDITKRDMARALNMNEASYGRIESGKIALSYSRLVDIASALDMTVVDLITYPDVYRRVDATDKNEDVETVLQIKIKNEKKDKVLKLVFGDINLEMLGK